MARGGLGGRGGQGKEQWALINSRDAASHVKERKREREEESV